MFTRGKKVSPLQHSRMQEGESCYSWMILLVL